MFRELAPLFTLPVLLIVTIAALDSADRQLLASSFPLLERTLNLSVSTLGYFSLFTNLSYALSLPFWSYLVHRYGLRSAPSILSASCCGWGFATLGIAASGSSLILQALFRSANGAALASIMPLSQTMLVEVIPPKLHGRAFGLMGLMEKMAGTGAAASVVYFDSWRFPYVVLGVASIIMALVARKTLTMSNEDNTAKEAVEEEEVRLTLRQIVRRIAQIPTFVFLVAQGVFGGVPWDMFSFLLLLWDWRGFTKEQIVSLQFSMGVSGMVGGTLGGILGDYFATHPRGRIYVAIISVASGIPLFVLCLYSTDYTSCFLWLNLFTLCGSWTPAAALRPLCAELTRNPSERAQIVAMWILLEKTSAAVFGAPLVGYLTGGMLEKMEMLTSEVKAQSLAFNLCYLSSFFWVVCVIFWILMAYTLDVKKSRTTYDRVEQEEVMLRDL